MGIYANVFLDGDHAADTDVRLGVDYANATLTGKLDLPAIADVRLGVDFDNATKTGLLDVDDEANLPTTTDVLEPVTYGSLLQFTGDYFTAFTQDVRLGVIYGKTNGSTGLLDLPAAVDVRLAVEFDQTTKIGLIAVPLTTEVTLGVAIDQDVGNVRVPIEADVRLLVLFGPNDTLIGSLDDSGDVCNYPGSADVRLDVDFAGGALTGNVRVPTPDKVESEFQYDTLDLITGTLLSTIASPFLTDDDFEIVRGDDYVEDDISWQDDGRWPDITGATIIVGFVGRGTKTEFPGVITGTAPPQVSLRLTKEETAILRDWYDYDVQATLSGGEVKTLVSGRVRASDTETDIPPDSPLPPGSPA